MFMLCLILSQISAAGNGLRDKYPARAVGFFRLYDLHKQHRVLF